MVKSSYRYLLYIVFFTFLFSAEYNTLYLMEFENSSFDYRTDYLRTYFPELVKNNYSDRDFNIGYAPNLLSNQENKTNTLKEGILLYGKYSSSYPNIIVSFEVYDVKTWEEKTSRSYRCEIDDEECIREAFLVCMDETVMPLFCEQYDCNGICSGNSVLDCNGDCNGSSVLDCNNTCNGNSYINECGECVLENIDICEKDCNNEWTGDAFLNECNVCVGGNTALEIDFGKDCFGVCGGTALSDCRGECDGLAIVDCNGRCEGFAYFNECNVCVAGDTGNPIDLGNDCNGECFGGAIFDLCGECGGNNTSCSDCNGIPFGSAYKDDCGVCDSNIDNDCIKDCNDTWGGQAYINECLVCVGGETEINENAGLDCNGICWGLSRIDDCGICNGPGSVYECGCSNIEQDKCDCYGNILDCNGTCGGEAILDECGVCNGNGSSCKNKTKNSDNSSSNSTDISLYPLLDRLSLIDTNIEKIPCKNCVHEPNINVIGNLSEFNNEDVKQNNTDKFLYIVDELFKDAYNIFVQDMEVEKLNEQNLIKLKIPVEYSVKKDLFETLLSDLAYNTKTNENGTFIIEILKDDIYITQNLLDYFSLMKYQIVPIILFTDNFENVKHIHVDSWNTNYNFKAVELNKNIDISITDQFIPLFSITPGENSIQLNFDPQSRTSIYELVFSLDEFNEVNYSKMSLKFIYENDLESHINSFADKF